MSVCQFIDADLKKGFFKMLPSHFTLLGMMTKINCILNFLNELRRNKL